VLKHLLTQITGSISYLNLTKENVAAADASLVTMSAGGGQHLDLSPHALAGLLLHSKVSSTACYENRTGLIERSC
jgi:hypothetical protein